MNKILSFVTLDFRLMKSNIVVIVFILVLGMVLSTFQKSGELMFAFAMLMLSTINLLFLHSEKYNLNILYGTLPINRKIQVFGRYIFVFLFTVTTVGFCFFASVLINHIFADEMNFYFLVFMLCSALPVFLIIMGIQIPFYFKYGFAKAQLVSFVPLFAVAIAIPSINSHSNPNIFDSTLIMNHIIAYCLVLLAIGLVTFAISCYISYKICDKKE